MSKTAKEQRRHTPQAEAVIAAIESADHPVTAQHVLETAASRVKGLGIATVHRHLKRLVEEGRLAKVEIAGEAPRFEPASRGCCQHFKCEACGRVFDIDPQPMPAAPVPAGFEVHHRHTLLVGLCAECR